MDSGFLILRLPANAGGPGGLAC